MKTAWSTLPSDAWMDTRATLHLWTQVVGKIRTGHAPWLNRSWSVPLYVTSRGLGTSRVPYQGEGFEIDFDLLGDSLVLTTTTGETRSVALEPRTVADSHAEVLGAMASVGTPVSIHPVPSEIPGAIPFPEDTTHASYGPEWWRDRPHE